MTMIYTEDAQAEIPIAHRIHFLKSAFPSRDGVFVSLDRTSSERCGEAKEM
jgi:hypothetical protein